MKKLLIGLLVLSTFGLAYAESSNYGTKWKQEDTTVLPADDVAYVDFSNISSIGIGGSGDMQASIYDPTTIAGDAFDYQNHFGNISTTNGYFSGTVQATTEVESALGDFTAVDIDGGTEATPSVQVGTSQSGLWATGNYLGLSSAGGRSGYVGTGTGDQTFFGYLAGGGTGGANDSNTAFGHTALQNNALGDGNTAVGNLAMNQNSTGSQSTAVGNGALRLQTTGGGNSVFGVNALRTCTGCNNNVAIGKEAMLGSTAGLYNTAIGYQAMNGASTGSNNLIGGHLAGGGVNTGSDNVVLGAFAMDAGNSGSDNVLIGYEAGTLATGMNFAVAIGHGALRDATTGDYTVAIGRQAATDTTTGRYNVAIGHRALQQNTDGESNVAIGHMACSALGLGNSNVCIGENAGAQATGSDELYIDNTNTTTPLIYGDFAGDDLTVNGSLTITEGQKGAVFETHSTITLDDTHFFIECDAAFGAVSTILPAVATSQGRVYHVKKMDASNNCTIDGNGAETIDGQATQAISTQYNSISIIGGTSEWLIY